MSPGDGDPAGNDAGGLAGPVPGNGSRDGQVPPVNDMLWITTERIPDVMLRLPAAAVGS